MTHAAPQPLDMTEASRILEAGGTLSRTAASPLWRQLGQRIEAAIQDGRLPPDSHLPSEHMLCRQFGVSRTVVREALGELANDGAIVKVRRRGVFVARQKADQEFPASNVGFFGEMTEKGHTVTTRIFSLAKAAPSPREREMLNLPPDEAVVRLERLAYADGRPSVFSTVALPAHKVPGLETLDMRDRSLYGTLREHYGLVARTAERWLDAALPTAAEATLLEITTATPVIAIESRACLANGLPIEYYTAIYNSRYGRIHLAVGDAALARDGAAP